MIRLHDLRHTHATLLLTKERTARLQRIADMSPEEYRLQAESAPVHRDWFRRQGGATEAEPQGLRDELGEGGRPGAR